MKIPEELRLWINTDGRGTQLIELWKRTADQVSMEYGMLVEVKIIPRPGPGSHMIDRLVFTVLDGAHEFESLNELKRALANKVFL